MPRHPLANSHDTVPMQQSHRINMLLTLSVVIYVTHSSNAVKFRDPQPEVYSRKQVIHV